MFKHSPNQISFPQEGQGNPTRPPLWCKFQERCNRRIACQFRHYDDEGQGGQEVLGPQRALRGQVDNGVIAGQGDQGVLDGQVVHGVQGGQGVWEAKAGRRLV